MKSFSHIKIRALEKNSDNNVAHLTNYTRIIFSLKLYCSESKKIKESLFDVGE